MSGAAEIDTVFHISYQKTLRATQELLDGDEYLASSLFYSF